MIFEKIQEEKSTDKTEVHIILWASSLSSTLSSLSSSRTSPSFLAFCINRVPFDSDVSMEGYNARDIQVLYDDILKMLE